MKTQIILIFTVLLFILFILSCSRVRESIDLTSNLKWNYIDETTSYLTWKNDFIVGPGSITLKCGRKYVYGYCHNKNSTMLFIIDTQSGDLIKNPQMKDVLYKYNVRLSNEVFYTQTEIFGDCKSKRAIEILKKDIENANGQKRNTGASSEQLNGAQIKNSSTPL